LQQPAPDHLRPSPPLLSTTSRSPAPILAPATADGSKTSAPPSSDPDYVRPTATSQVSESASLPPADPGRTLQPPQRRIEIVVDQAGQPPQQPEPVVAAAGSAAAEPVGFSAMAAAETDAVDVFVDEGSVDELARNELALASNLQHISDREEIKDAEARLKSIMIPQSASASASPSAARAMRSPSSNSDTPPPVSRQTSRRQSINVENNLPENGLRRANSTGTLFVDSTVSAPNKDDTLACVALAIHYIIVDGHNQEDPMLYSEHFDEKLHPLTDARIPENYAEVIPSDTEIFTFMNRLFDAAALSAECGIITMVYINRCIQYTDLAVHATNWKRVLLGGILMASKVWDDQAVWNVDYCSILPKIEVEDMNELERVLLEMLQFNINVDSSVYTKYYFELRSMAAAANRPFPLEPISTEQASKLEATSKHVKDVVMKGNLRTAKSMDYKEFAAKAVLP